MSLLWSTLKWDFLRLIRYNIVGISIVVTLIYIAVFLNIPSDNLDQLVIFMIFNDPAGLGMLFIGSLVLFEKTDQTIFALSVTPLKPWQYLWSKAISLTLIATICSWAMAITGHSFNINHLALIVGISLSSIFFIFLGIIVVSYSNSFNEYILKMAASLVPVGLPFLNLFGLTDTFWWYLIPSQATLILLEATFYPQPIWKLIYAVVYLTVAVIGSYFFAEKVFVQKIFR